MLTFNIFVVSDLAEHESRTCEASSEGHSSDPDSCGIGVRWQGGQ